MGSNGITRSCDACGVAYRPSTSSSRYCSLPCLWSRNGGQNKKEESWWVNKNGYEVGRIYVDGRVKYVRRHRLIMEQHLGRVLLSSEDVHHLNGIKTDNRIENLQVIDHREHGYLSEMERRAKKGAQR